MYRHFVKPVFDFILAFSAFIVSLPLFLVISLLLMAANSGKAFFVQDRVGKDNKVFKLLKFKTMNDKTDASGELLSDEQRLTKIGNWIRRTSLDEIPQFINILKGDMSLIGPRPLLTEYLNYYNKEQIRRHKVKPGISGWAQINGRNAISWKKKFELDLWYVENISFKTDVLIILKTLHKVFKSEDINTEQNKTPPKFDGTN